MDLAGNWRDDIGTVVERRGRGPKARLAAALTITGSKSQTEMQTEMFQPLCSELLLRS